MPPDTERFESLVAAACHGQASEKELQELAAMLEDPAAQEAYIRYTDLHATLASDDALFARGDVAGEAMVDFPGGVRAPLSGRKEGAPEKRRPVLLLAALALIAGAFALVIFRGTEAPEQANPEVSAGVGPSAMASITMSIAAEWEGESPAFEIADTRSLALNAGVIQIEFASGAILVAEGPLRAELLSAAALRLERGKVRARIPPQGDGFTLYTKALKIVDSGSEFAVSIDKEGAAEVHALAGEIEIVPSVRSSKRRALAAGEAVSVDSQPPYRATSRPANPSAFIGIRQLDERARADRDARQAAWRAQIDRLKNDPALRVLYTFERHATWERTVRNEAAEAARGTDGAITVSPWTRGRWPEKGAVDFHRPSHRMRARINGEFEAFTIMAWIYLAVLPDRPQTLLSTLPPESGRSFHPSIQLLESGGLALVLRKPGTPKTRRFLGESALTGSHAGHWIHVAATATGENGRILARLFVNGSKVSEESVKTADAVFAFGRYDIGNTAFPPQRKGGSSASRSKRPSMYPLMGLIDEFALLERALPPAEIEQAWRSGRVH